MTLYFKFAIINVLKNGGINMSDLKIDYNKIKDLISLSAYWEYTHYTNCYAFALGLDVPENKIVENAYQLGVIGANAKQIPIESLKKLTFEERLFLDLEALGIKYNVSNVDASCSDKWWIISLLSNGNDFHFIRKYYDGIWYHKWGYLGPVIDYDFDKKIITDPKTANFREYKLVKTYKLSKYEK